MVGLGGIHCGQLVVSAWDSKVHWTTLFQKTILPLERETDGTPSTYWILSAITTNGKPISHHWLCISQCPVLYSAVSSVHKSAGVHFCFPCAVPLPPCQLAKGVEGKRNFLLLKSKQNSSEEACSEQIPLVSPSSIFNKTLTLPTGQRGREGYSSFDKLPFRDCLWVRLHYWANKRPVASRTLSQLHLPADITEHWYRGAHKQRGMAKNNKVEC